VNTAAAGLDFIRQDSATNAPALSTARSEKSEASKSSKHLKEQIGYLLK
jgi:hypothetical protein